MTIIPVLSGSRDKAANAEVVALLDDNHIPYAMCLVDQAHPSLYFGPPSSAELIGVERIKAEMPTIKVLTGVAEPGLEDD